MSMFLAIFLFSTITYADVVKKTQDDEGYGYEFDDDPLNAMGFGPNHATIIIRPRAARVTLIRPRTSFVYEMVKSVEDI